MIEFICILAHNLSLFNHRMLIHLRFCQYTATLTLQPADCCWTVMLRDVATKFLPWLWDDAYHSVTIRKQGGTGNRGFFFLGLQRKPHSPILPAKLPSRLVWMRGLYMDGTFNAATL